MLPSTTIIKKFCRHLPLKLNQKRKIPLQLKNLKKKQNLAAKNPIPNTISGHAYEATTTIANKTGIHSRPASALVQKACSFKSKIQIKAKAKTVDAKSILMIMSMGLVKGTEITICTDGPDAKEAVEALKALVDSKFGEE